MSDSTAQPDLDVVIIGAGVCGIYQLYRMLDLGVRVRVLEAGDGPGGTWHWNRYPGARFDSESYSYAYSFSKELLQEWDWKEHFSAQPDTLRYLNYVVDKFELREHMTFGVRVQAATFDKADGFWRLQLDSGEVVTARFMLTAVGMLSAATQPRIKGVETFEGQAFHTYHWPRDGVDLAGKRVAVIGTGATGVQVIAEIADKVGALTVFQRRPNWCAPLNNRPITDEEQAAIKASYDEIFALCERTPGAFMHEPDRREFDHVPPGERTAFWEQLYAGMGFGIWLGNFREVLMDETANAEFSAFLAAKIRGRVNDPAVAEKLIPKDHGFGSRRVPLETRYFEAYNRDNVRLVDISETPIECINASGIKTTTEQLDFDVIVFATGFDAITGAFDRIDITGPSGVRLKEKWDDGPLTYLGLQVNGFPNMVTLAGPQSASVGTNFPRAIEDVVDWTSDFIKYLFDNDITYFEAVKQAEDEWVEHVKSFYGITLAGSTKSWFTGYNSNVDGHEDKLRHMVYFGGAPKYRELLAEVAEDGYRGVSLGTPASH